MTQGSMHTNTPFSLFDDLKKKVDHTGEAKAKGEYKIIQDTSSNPYEFWLCVLLYTTTPDMHDNNVQ